VIFQRTFSMFDYKRAQGEGAWTPKAPDVGCFCSSSVLRTDSSRRSQNLGNARQDHFGPLLDLAVRVRHQEQRQRGPKVYSLHAPEVESIGRGKTRAPYEFGCKVSIGTPATAPKGGQFVLHARRIHGDKGYRGHNDPDRFRVWISGQVRRVTKVIRREMRRRAAVEPVIGPLKNDHRMRRNYLKGRDGDRINAVLAAAGYNFSLLLRWFEELLRVPITDHLSQQFAATLAWLA
jgi:transposase, IS5 family